MNNLINTADLKELILNSENVTAIAIRQEMIEGYLLHIEANSEQYVLSTYLSNKTRLFKRSDALLKEARSLGFKTVEFELQ
jgi:hypothetical protein